MKTVVLVTGGFDPVHSGHIRYLKAAKELGDVLYVGVNSDDWLTRKKGRPFLPMIERMTIIQNLKMVDYVLEFLDGDNSARNAIRMVHQMHPNDKIIFANGGDRTATNIPEMDLTDDPRFENLEFKFGVGGEDKANSSSWILEEWKLPKTIRPWGYYRVLFEPNPYCKVKELTVLPGQSLSMQRHRSRKEFWFVSQGVALVSTLDENNVETNKGIFTLHQQLNIGYLEWHRLQNKTANDLKIIEIQYGDACYEEDIERRNV
jgi:cytidyltransferase-like protein